MLHIKRLYKFVLLNFFQVFLMTFFISLFILLMQFLWRYIDDLVGKGLELNVIAELFFYAALSLVPMALPLAILLASLMTFGNLGESLELTAMKSAGISLLRVMRPIIIFLSVVAVGAFFFQNNVLPYSQVKMWTLLYSAREKSPELDIPENIFYDQIPGYNLFVREKDKQNGTLRNLMIYDMSGGFDNARVILADSGKLSVTPDKKYLYLRLYQGESFENLRAQNNVRGNIPYRRESFSNKDILINFDANFNRLDDNTMSSQYVGKNISQLQATIDSVNVRIDSIGGGYAHDIKRSAYFAIHPKPEVVVHDGLNKVESEDRPIVVPSNYNVDSILNCSDVSTKQSVVSRALVKAQRFRQDYEYKSYSMKDDRYTVRRHEIEKLKKFTLSFACLIFFFIGAPLGAIIRKGGLGMPVVISVFLFIFYFIIDNTGYKLARDGFMQVTLGIWLSSIVLLPLGIFLTYKAINDSAVFNPDVYINFFKRITGQNLVRNVELKEIVMDDVETDVAIDKIEALNANCTDFIAANSRHQNYFVYWTRGYSRTVLHDLSSELENVVAYVGNYKDQLIINKLMDYPFIVQMMLYHPTNYKFVSYICMILLPIGIPAYLLGIYQQRNLRRELKQITVTGNELITLIKNREIKNHNI